MKKIALLIAMGLFTTLTAQARAPWDCDLTFKAKGGGLQVLVGWYELKGTGNLRCADLAGNRQVIPVKLKFGGRALAPNVAIGGFEMAGVATGIGLSRGPEGLYGKYVTASADAAAIIGAGAKVAFHGGREAITLNIGIDAIYGLGAQVGLDRLVIEPLDAYNPPQN